MSKRWCFAATSRPILLAIGLGFGAVAWAPVHAASIERVEAGDLAAAPAVYPGSEAGEMRTWVQLIWDPVTAKLVRRSYTALDPVPSLGLELSWQPDDPAADEAGPISGRGVLTFRKPGAPTYDPNAAVAQYRGEMIGGKAEGSGEFLHASGFSYVGSWRGGLMHGEGRLSLPNGDQYVGAFAGGKRDGEGVYIDATGTIYDGRFAADLRDGAGIFVPATGEAYTADWLAGEEVSGTRDVVDPAALGHVQLIDAQYETYDDLRIGVVAERLPRLSDFGYTPLSYTSRSEGQRLEIFPDDERLLAVWHGTEPIQMTDTERYEFGDYGYSPSFLGAYERFEPVSLIFELENISTESVAIVGAFLDVEASRRDPEPAVQLRPVYNDGCEGNDSYIVPFFRFDNFGWTPAENAGMTVTFGSVAGERLDREFNQSLGTIRQTLEVSVAGELNELGVDTELLGTEKLQCSDLDEAICLGEVRDTGKFGELGDFLSLNGTILMAQAEGELGYDWVDADGERHHKTSPFTTDLVVGEVFVDAECGEGGEIVPVKHDPFVFELDQEGYRIAIPIVDDVASGFTGRWRVKFTAAETSTHDFRLVLVLADGREVASRPISLLYFMPPKDFDPAG